MGSRYPATKWEYTLSGYIWNTVMRGMAKETWCFTYNLCVKCEEKVQCNSLQIEYVHVVIENCLKTFY